MSEIHIEYLRQGCVRFRIIHCRWFDYMHFNSRWITSKKLPRKSFCLCKFWDCLWGKTAIASKSYIVAMGHVYFTWQFLTTGVVLNLMNVFYHCVIQVCISKSAVRTKFEQHSQRGRNITSSLKSIMEETYQKSQKQG